MAMEQDRVPLAAEMPRESRVVAAHSNGVPAALRMSPARKSNSAELAERIYEDTIDLALSPEQVQALSQAAGEKIAGAELPESAAAPSATTPTVANETLRRARYLLIPAACALGIAVGLAVGLAARSVRTEIIRVPVIVTRAATPPAEPPPAPVRFGNPFDSSEVFELPPGTNATEARHSVAEMLLQRARDRRGTGGVQGDRLISGTRDGPVARISGAQSSR
jgi:hypothetical protein